MPRGNNQLGPKDKKALKKLDWYLKQRRQLVLSDTIIHAAIFKRIKRLHSLASELETDNSPSMYLCGHKTYAWDVDDIAWELQFLFNEL